MTPTEFKEARQKLGLTQSQLGDLLDTNPSTIRRWEMDPKQSTSRPPNPVAAKVMGWFLAGFRPEGWPS